MALERGEIDLEGIFKKCARIKVFSCEFFERNAQDLFNLLTKYGVSEMIGTPTKAYYDPWYYRMWWYGIGPVTMPDKLTLPEDLKKLPSRPQPQPPEPPSRPTKPTEEPPQPNLPPKKQRPIDETKKKQSIKEETEHKTDAK